LPEEGVVAAAAGPLRRVATAAAAMAAEVALYWLAESVAERERGPAKGPPSLELVAPAPVAASRL
jgi:hypothetical protein